MRLSLQVVNGRAALEHIMSRARVFLSSTCYDLKALREHLREKVQEFGHELLASEYPSFPVSPDLSTVENCKKAVRDHADLLVLIVGGRRGSLDVSGMRSVVNAEYLEARAKGIACFIFVDKQVWDLLPIYLSNPTGNFSSVVDHPEVFKFVEELRAEARWIYPFTTTEDIILTLRNQLSTHFRTLIERGRAGTLIVPREFVSEPLSVISLIQERPPYWEHLLTCELLENSLALAHRRLDELNKGVVYRRVQKLSDDEVTDRLSAMFADMINIGAAFEPAAALIPPTWGPPGVSGDPFEIRRACGHIVALIEGLTEWETELRFVRVSEKFQPLFDSLRNSTHEIIEELARLPREVRQIVEKAKTNPGPHTINIDLNFVPPAVLKRFWAEMEKLGWTPPLHD